MDLRGWRDSIRAKASFLHVANLDSFLVCIVPQLPLEIYPKHCQVSLTTSLKNRNRIQMLNFCHQKVCPDPTEQERRNPTQLLGQRESSEGWSTHFACSNPCLVSQPWQHMVIIQKVFLYLFELE